MSLPQPIEKLTAVLRIRVKPRVQAGPYNVDIFRLDHPESPPFVARFRVVTGEGWVGTEGTNSIFKRLWGFRGGLVVRLLRLDDTCNEVGSLEKLVLIKDRVL